MGEIILNTFTVLIQIALNMYFLFTLSESIENTKYQTYRKVIGIVLFSICAFISAYIPFQNQIIKTILCALPTFITLKFILRLNIIKSILITITTFLVFAITEVVAVIIMTSIFKFEILQIKNSFWLTLLLVYIQILIVFIIIKIILVAILKYKKTSQVADIINSNQLFNILIIISICILPKVIIRIFDNYNYPTSYLVASFIETIVMVALTFIFFKRTIERDKAKSELILSEMHNKTMIGVVDGVRTLKHDYNNIIQALSGYVKTKQYDKLEEHIDKVLQECNVVNNFSVITPEIFNEPAIYGIMGAKYFIAVDKEITVDLDVTCDFTKISFPMPELSRILGILLDNAIEATQKSDNKYIRFEARYDARKNADIIRIFNTYDSTINVDLNKIYEKGVSSKKVKSGIGLWEVKKLVKKNKNSQIYATIENGKFIENLIIERFINYNDENNESTLIPINK